MAERLSPTLRAVSDAVLAVAAELSVDDVLQRLVDSSRELAGARYAALGLPDGEGGRREMAVGLEHHGESYGLLVDEIGEVMKLSPSSHEPNPVHLDERWLGLSRGVHRLEHGLLIILDIDAVLAFGAEARAA